MGTRKSDPVTSLLADKYNKLNQRDTQHQLVLKTLEEHPNSTYRELTKYAKYFECTLFSRRLPELVRKGKVVRRDPRICTVGGRLCTVWDIADNG